MQSLSRLVARQLRQSHAASAATAALLSGSSDGVLTRWFTEGTTDEGQAEATGVTKRLYVSNLSYDMRRHELAQLFEKYGTVHETVLPTRPDGRHKGYGFVELEVDAADAAMQALHETEVQGRTIKVAEAEGRGSRPRRDGAADDSPRASGRRDMPFVRPGYKRLFVANLSFRTSAADLGRHFQQFGQVQDCVIPLNAMGRSRGFGFVEIDEAGAAAAMAALDQVEFDGRVISVREQHGSN